MSRPTRRLSTSSRAALLAVLLSTLMSTVDASIVNLALPRIAIDLHASPDRSVWVATAFLLAVACAVPAMAALSEQFGRRRLFLIGVSVFSAASLGCAAAPTIEVLIAMRVLQGGGSAATLAVVIPLIRGMFRPDQLGRALGLNAMAVALGTTLGPTLGGLLLAVLPWPWLFVINVPVGAVCLGLAAKTLPREAYEGGDYDWPGASLVAVTVGTLLMCLVEAGSATPGPAIAFGIVCGVCVALLLRREKIAARPVLPLSLFTRPFCMAVGAAHATFIAQGVAFVALPFLLQGSLRATPLQSALLFTPWPLMIVFVAPQSGRLSDRLSARLLAIVGSAVLALGLAMLAVSGPTPKLWLVLAATAVCGTGFGTFQSPNNRDIMATAPLWAAASAAAIQTTNRSVGQSVGAAVVGVALLYAGTTASPAEQASAASGVLWVAAVAALVATGVSAARHRAAVFEKASQG